MYLLLTIAVCFFGGFYFTKKDYVHKKAKKIRNLFHLVKTQHKNILKIVWIMMVLLVKAFYVWLCQTLNGSFRQIDKNTFEVSYVVGGVYALCGEPVVVDDARGHGRTRACDADPVALAHAENAPREGWREGTLCNPLPRDATSSRKA